MVDIRSRIHCQRNALLTVRGESKNCWRGVTSSCFAARRIGELIKGEKKRRKRDDDGVSSLSPVVVAPELYMRNCLCEIAFVAGVIAAAKPIIA